MEKIPVVEGSYLARAAVTEIWKLLIINTKKRRFKNLIELGSSVDE